MARVQSMVLKIRGAQMRGANRIDELQDSHDGHEAKLLELGETLSRIEAKLDRILEPDQPD